MSIDMSRHCNTCKHREMSPFQLPCRECSLSFTGGGHDKKWEPVTPVFETGQVVKLKSGGPEMTVEGEDKATFGNSNEVAVTWFDVNGLLCRSTINKNCLEVVK